MSVVAARLSAEGVRRPDVECARRRRRAAGAMPDHAAADELADRPAYARRTRRRGVYFLVQPATSASALDCAGFDARLAGGYRRHSVDDAARRSASEFRRHIDDLTAGVTQRTACDVRAQPILWRRARAIRLSRRITPADLGVG